VELGVPEIDDDGRFEGGTMTVTGGNVYTIIDNVEVTGADDDYTMSTPVAAGALDQEVVVRDDDAFVLPRIPDADIDVLNTKYKPCYVEFIEVLDATDDDVVFVAMMPEDPPQARAKIKEKQSLHPAPDFWTALILSGFQTYDEGDDSSASASSADLDPDGWYHVHGADPTFTFWKVGDGSFIAAISLASTSPIENGTIIYQEGIRDYLAQIATYPHTWPGHSRTQTHAFVETRVIAHEIAHQFGIVPHTLGSLVDDWTGTDDSFFGDQIKEIRRSPKLGEE
jgi:hypothetical protein